MNLQDESKAIRHIWIHQQVERAYILDYIQNMTAILKAVILDQVQFFQR